MTEEKKNLGGTPELNDAALGDDALAAVSGGLDPYKPGGGRKTQMAKDALDWVDEDTKKDNMV